MNASYVKFIHHKLIIYFNQFIILLAEMLYFILNVSNFSVKLSSLVYPWVFHDTTGSTSCQHVVVWNIVVYDACLVCAG